MHIATSLAHIRHELFHWSFSILHDTLLYFGFAIRLVTCLDYFQAWLLLQRRAWRWGYVLLSFSLWEAAACPASAFCFSKIPLYTFRPHGDTVGTSQKFRLSSVTNSCTVCNLPWWFIKWKGVNRKLLCAATPLL